MKKFILFLVLFMVFGCVNNSVSIVSNDSDMSGGVDSSNSSSRDESGGVKKISDWRSIDLESVQSGEVFSINDFNKPVLLETFAVWCPKCKAQQDEIKKVHEQLGNDIVIVSVDLDRSESKSKVLDHVNRYGYDWRFSIDVNGFGKSLIEEFGINVANAPNAPVIVVCPIGSSELLSFGVKSSDSLIESVESICS